MTWNEADTAGYTLRNPAAARKVADAAIEAAKTDAAVRAVADVAHRRGAPAGDVREVLSALGILEAAQALAERRAERRRGESHGCASASGFTGATGPAARRQDGAA